MKDQLEKVFDNIAASAVPAQEDYTDSETGLLHCGKCHTPIQCRVTLFDKEKLMPCTCRCRQEQIAAEEQARKEQQRLDRIRRLKANGLQDKALLAYTFDKADGDNSAMKYAHRYVTHWAEVKAEGQGLLFWGGVGTGKTFAAACIANALTEQGIPVLMTNFSKILNSLSGDKASLNYTIRKRTLVAGILRPKVERGQIAQGTVNSMIIIPINIIKKL